MSDKKKPIGKTHSGVGHSITSTSKKSRSAASTKGKQKKKVSSSSVKTSRKRHHKTEFSRNKTILRMIVDTPGFTMTLFDTDGTVLFANRYAALNLSGDGSADITGKHISEFVPKAQVERLIDECRRVISTGKPIEQEVMITMQDEDRWFLNTLYPMSLSAKGGPAVLSTSHDITELKIFEKALVEHEGKYRFFIENANDAILIHSFDENGMPGPFTEVNDLVCKWSGYSRDELARMRPGDLDDPDYREQTPHVVEQLKTVGYSMFETVWIRKDGGLVHVEVSSRLMTMPENTYIVSFARDITERKQTEEALKKREKQLAESQRIAHIGSWEHNLKTGQVFWSDELFRLLGLDPEKDPGDFKMFFEMIHPDDQPILKAAIDKTLKERTPFSVNYRFNFRDGTTGIIYARAELIEDDEGDPVILSGTAQDITEEKLAEDKIRKSEEFIRSILDTVDEGFIVVDREYRIVTANAAYCSQVSKSSEEVIGRHCYEISHKAKWPCFENGEDCAVRKAFTTGEPHTALHRHSENGHILFVETKAYPLKDDSGSVTSVIETINNITEKHLLEEERLKTQKLESIGVLAGGIAHDFNNLLQGIFGYIAIARIAIDDRERTLAVLEQAERALQQSVNLTNQLLTFSKGGEPVTRIIDLRPVIRDATAFAMSGSHSYYHINIDNNLWNVMADAGQIAQVMQNIVLNADQAMPGGGRITIAAENIPVDHPRLPSTLVPRDYVAIEVSDNGVGIPDRHRDKIFDPYFSTKENGSGLGLATSYSIMKKHGGTITLTSRPDNGSTFTIYLPAALADAVERTTPDRARAPRKARVLVMDDEEIVRDVTGHMLEELDLEVTFATHGEETLALYRGALEARRPFDIVIMDLTIRGGMGGLETLRKLIEINPAVTAVVSSGYSEDPAVAEFRKHGFKAFLKKPYNIEELKNTLYSLL